VRLTASDGKIGWGQIAPYEADISAKVLHRLIARRVIGRDISEIPSRTMRPSPDRRRRCSIRCWMRDGRAVMPDGPGWGVRIKADWLAGAERRITQA
jgi:L-alanine-DL-glutamate epimerase-like enolase superfamily enzyme